MPLSIAVAAVLATGACSTPSSNYQPKASPSPSSSSPSSSSSTSVEPEPAETSSASASADVGTAANPAPYGKTFEGSTWSISVDAVNATDANAQLTAENSFNNDPKFGQYVIATISATNISQDVGDPSDLVSAFEFVGADNRLYDHVFAVVADDLSQQPKTLNGGKVSGNIVFDVTPEAVGDRKIAATSGEDGSLTIWSGATTS